MEVDNRRGLFAGSIESIATTFIDVIQLPDPTNPNAIVLNAIALSAGSGTVGGAGHAHDVAITPGGAVGVVNYANSVTFIKMDRGTHWATFNLMVLGMPPGQASLISPEGATDSIALTDKVVAVISTRNPATPTAMPWIFLFDIAQPTPINFWATPFVNPASIPDPEVPNSHARSVRIAPDERQVVMTADKIVATKSLVVGGPSLPFPAAYVDIHEGRPYLEIRDSLEVTNTRAVALSNNALLPSGFPQGRITILDITAGGSAIGPLGSFPFDLGATASNRVHDLAVSKDGASAVIKSEEENLVYTNLASPTPTLARLPSLGNPLVFGGPFVSDSIAFRSDGSTAIAIGALGPTQTSPWHSGIVDFISVTGGGGQITSVHSRPTSHVDAADLKLTRDESRVLVRFRDRVTPSFPPGSFTGQDFVLFTVSGTALAQFTADGTTFRLDDVEVGGALHDGPSATAIGIGETFPSTSSPVDGHVQLMWFW